MKAAAAKHPAVCRTRPLLAVRACVDGWLDGWLDGLMLAWVLGRFLSGRVWVASYPDHAGDLFPAGAAACGRITLRKSWLGFR